jgi:hypothetical protein
MPVSLTYFPGTQRYFVCTETSNALVTKDQILRHTKIPSDFLRIATYMADVPHTFFI